MFKLAERLKMTVGELSSRMDSAELAEWIAFDRLERLETTDEDYRTARIIWWMIQIHANKEFKRTFKFTDLLPNAKPSHARPQSPEEIQGVFAAIAKRKTS